MNLELAELAFTAVFTVEMVLRIISAGSLGRHFKQPWNAFDGVMVLVGYVQYIPTNSSSGVDGVRALRALRALRPLRTISRIEGLR